VHARTAFAVAALACSAVNAAQGYEPVVNFQLHCMGCHLPDGSGQPGRVPSIRRSLLLFSGFPEGRNYVVRVPGVAQSALSDADTAALLNWMARNLSDVAGAPTFADYSEAEIRGLRHSPLVKVRDIRARLMKAAAGKPPSTRPDF
jgi:cytochrome c551/c552